MLLYRWRARYAHLTLPRGCWPGFPADVREAAGHHPDFPGLRGWVFHAWQYHPSKLNVPWWWEARYPETYDIPRNHWVLRRVGDPHPYAVMSPQQFDRWQSYDHKTRSVEHVG